MMEEGNDDKVYSSKTGTFGLPNWNIRFSRNSPRLWIRLIYSMIPRHIATKDSKSCWKIIYQRNFRSVHGVKRSNKGIKITFREMKIQI
jgi:hypothetical protein